ncbi:hypothetical protein OU426_08510 [Frigidibacter sp. RF13]|uniref:hypothetical protein n=1 Tax=Frigidibacter sp. RF13 TaxID=2997340 RepID=UPI00226D42B3|nr:hypothetical protein [Frigidibacter sp. RF13]MCY1126893.1 hypothetical protein [Frigidibacter sp. RF13]
MDVPIGFSNTFLPILILGAAAISLPRLIVPKETRSHRMVISGVLLSAFLVQALSTALTGYMFAQIGADVGGALSDAPGETMFYLIRTSFLPMIAWGPLMLISWLSLSRRTERLRGQDLARNRLPE